MQAYKHTYINADMQTYLHLHMHTHVHAYAYMHVSSRCSTTTNILPMLPVGQPPVLLVGILSMTRIVPLKMFILPILLLFSLFRTLDRWFLHWFCSMYSTSGTIYCAIALLAFRDSSRWHGQKPIHANIDGQLSYERRVMDNRRDENQPFWSTPFEWTRLRCWNIHFVVVYFIYSSIVDFSQPLPVVTKSIKQLANPEKS